MKEKFLDLIQEILEIDDRKLQMSDKFKEFKEWDSLALLSVIAMIDSEYDVQIESMEMEKLSTMEDLYNAIIVKQNK